MWGQWVGWNLGGAIYQMGVVKARGRRICWAIYVLDGENLLNECKISHGLIGQTQVSVGFVGQFLKLPAGQMQIFDGFVGQMQVSDGFVARFVG